MSETNNRLVNLTN